MGQGPDGYGWVRWGKSRRGRAGIPVWTQRSRLGMGYVARHGGAGHGLDRRGEARAPLQAWSSFRG